MKKTYLYNEHVKLNAKMVDFNGFLMPVSYSSIIQEHNNVRKNCGIFDVSHMGEILICGSEAEFFLDHICTNNISRLKDGQVMYTCMCYENGNTVDDILVYRFSSTKYLCVVNASNIDKDLSWMLDNNLSDAVIENISKEYSQIALQGPKAESLVAKIYENIALPPFFYLVISKTRIYCYQRISRVDFFPSPPKNS